MKLSDALRRLVVEKLIADLRDGRKISDLQFDHVYPPAIRDLSRVHWTPVEVALRAAEFLTSGPETRVLDVGSGCGKFCTVAALAGRGRFVGIEQRPHLLATAEKVAEELGASRASFVSGNMADLDWSHYDAFYLFNPFHENLMKSIRIDATVPFMKGAYTRYVEIVRAKLRIARNDTRVATYHGFGGEMPPGYRCVKKEPMGTDFLELWIKSE